MLLSDLSVKRPVFAMVMSLLLVVLGVIAFLRLPLRELPNIDPPVVSIDTNYVGASAAVVETRVTQVLEDAVAGIEGIESVQSSSRSGRSTITLEFTLSRDIEGAANDVRDAVSRAADRLPEEVNPPQVAKVEGDADVIIWLNLSSSQLDTLALTDYADRYVVDRLSSLDGVAQVNYSGGQRYAMRIWMNREALAARNLTVSDIENALRRENVELPAGRIESDTRDFTLRIARDYRTPDDFGQMAIGKGEDGHVIRLAEVAKVERGAEERRAWFRGNGTPMVGLGIVKTSTANSLEVAKNVKTEMARIQESLPEGTTIGVSYDSTIFIDAAVNQVYKTLFEAVALVLVVIFLFLGSVRAALIPAVTVPVCVVAAFFGLYAFGFSINLLTLLALVLSIGLVVDDAIVVLENCQRRCDLGEPPLIAAYRGARQVAFAVIATTAVLVAVFLPIAFMEGNNGRLFRELAVAVASAVAISAFVALTLTPMMCSRLLRPHAGQQGFTAWTERRLESLSQLYRRSLQASIGHTWAIAGVLAIAAVAIGLLFSSVPRELAPPEDRGAFFTMVQGPEGAGFDYTVRQVQEVENRLLDMTTGNSPVYRINARVPGGFGRSEEMHTGQAVVLLKPWQERTLTTVQVLEEARKRLAGIPGVRAIPIIRQGLVRSMGQPLQVVLGGPSYDELVGWRDRLLARMEKNPSLFAVDSDYKETRPQLRVAIDRSRASDMGVAVADIGRTLETMMGSRRVTTFIDGGEEYDVIVQAQESDRRSPTDLTNLYVRGRGGQLIPLSNLVTLTELAEPGTLNRFNRMRAITLSAGLAPGYTLGEALEWMKKTAAEELPQVAQLDYKGESREYQKAGGAVAFTFAMALLIVFLVLAAQFESFIHPLVIMLTVPLAVLGALLGLWLWGSSLNLFSQIGIVMLVGLAAKNGILIVEFANQLRDNGREIRDAILEAASVRLRPILMTSVATMTGAVPLVLASGAGAASRVTIGVVVVFGVAFSTALSLFVVPAFYLLLARFTRSPESVARQIHAEGEAFPDAEQAG
ncbi:efflux RND transporter permease subunit [Tahibacter amnicola]|uniref:Efflux RND transporter permease subunit n=1 Tax=Tahibacter amnicola TaxID=2976241 RepID=A0ABY6BG99_9GAMM|nr:efflux RND transporter permease subunit [Tahibacter amnicola]UXI68894.1 efflux RND transporter permease subunit [Tahibacter amnicola]